ncbi:hypothetical protein [Orbus mooreae]|uniref:hypothetical protein n=1 Tax=Orbus mooreae TaxID=3074107 RepID=UPI00370CFE1A
MTIATDLLLNSQENKKWYRYLLLDGLETINERHRLHINMLSENIGNDCIYTIPRPEITHDLKSCPKLILLAKPEQNVDESLVQACVERSEAEYLFRKNYICSLFSSHLSPTKMVEGIVSTGLSLGRIFGSPFLPFYEPFRMQLFEYGNQICPEWLPIILSIFKQYNYFTIEKDLRMIKAFENDHITTPELFITHETHFYQKEAKKIQALHIAWSEICRKGKNTLANDYDIISLARFYQDSQRIGLSNTEDSFMFVLYSQYYGYLLKSNLIKQAIDEAVKDQGSLLDRFKLIDEKEFIQLKDKA